MFGVVVPERSGPIGQPFREGEGEAEAVGWQPVPAVRWSDTRAGDGEWIALLEEDVAATEFPPGVAE